jgi:hypothetical protein
VGGELENRPDFRRFVMLWYDSPSEEHPCAFHSRGGYFLPALEAGRLTVRRCGIRAGSTSASDPELRPKAGSQSEGFRSGYRRFVGVSDETCTNSQIRHVLKPSTLLRFLKVLVKRKYRAPFSSKHRGRRGAKGPARELINAVVEMKRRNPRSVGAADELPNRLLSRLACDIDSDVVRRILGVHLRPESGKSGPSWLTFLSHTKDSLWSADLFRLESLKLRTHWVLVLMDQYARRIIGFGIHRGVVDGAALCRNVPAGDKAEIFTQLSQHRQRSLISIPSIPSMAGQPSHSGRDGNQNPTWSAALRHIDGSSIVVGSYQTPIAAWFLEFATNTIADMMGHADVPTQFIYIQSEDRMKRVAAEKITDELSRYVVQDDQMSLRFANWMTLLRGFTGEIYGRMGATGIEPMTSTVSR